jgi:hypothetical protein
MADAVAEVNFTGKVFTKGAGNQFEQCRFPTTTGTDEACPPAALYRKIQIAKDLLTGV